MQGMSALPLPPWQAFPAERPLVCGPTSQLLASHPSKTGRMLAGVKGRASPGLSVCVEVYNARKFGGICSDCFSMIVVTSECVL